MHAASSASVVPRALSQAPRSAVSALYLEAYERDAPRLAIPYAEVHLVARFGPSARGGLDVHVLGGRQRAHRKLIRGGQRAVTARLRLGTHEAVLGASASELADRIVPLEDLWGDDAARRLTDALAAARSSVEAVAIVDAAMAERLSTTRARHENARLVLAAAEGLKTLHVNAVADALGVSERNLRRVFREVVGMAPKAFAKLARFHRALDAANDANPASWADIAVASGYYDQAHLIAEFRELAGTTPRALVGEMRAGAANTTRVGAATIRDLSV